MLIAIFLLFFYFPDVRALSMQTDPEVVARVNGEPVARAEFQRMLGNPLIRHQLQQELGIENPELKELERLALRKVVHHHLMLQEANRRKMTVTNDELDEAITTLRRRFDDLKDFGLWMKEQGIDDKSLFETVKRDILTERVWVSLVEGVRVKEKEVSEYFEGHKEELIIGEEVRLRIIAVKDKAEAEEILAALRNGASFDRLARQRSIGLRAAQGGDTGWIDSRILPQSLHKAVPLLKPSDVAGPLEKGPSEFLIVGLQGRRPIQAKSLAEARPEIERRLLLSAQQTAVKTWLEEQEKKSKIELFFKTE